MNVIDFLVYYFTPIKLYGGEGGDSGGGDSGVGEAADAVGASIGVSAGGPEGLSLSAEGSRTSSGRSGLGGSSIGGDGGEGGEGSNNSNVATQVGMASQKEMDAIAEAGMLGIGVRANAPLYSVTMKDNTISVVEGVNTVGNEATVTTEVNFGFFNNTKTVTTSIANSLGGLDVSIAVFGMVNTLNTFTTGQKGSITQHNTTVGIGTTSFSFNTHYWGANNTEFGFAAEAVADIAESLGASKSTTIGLAAVAEIASVLANIAMPSMQILSAGRAIGGITGLGLSIAGIKGLYDSLQTISTVANSLGAPTNNNAVNSVANSLVNGISSGGDSDIDNIVRNELFNEEFLPNLITTASNNLLRGQPKLYTPKKFIQPKLNQENNMKSQQAVYLDYRGGLSEILASNLLAANEGSIYKNINIDKGIMQSEKKGTLAINQIANAYFKFLPNDYYFSDSYPFSMVELGNFMYLTTENPIYTKVYQLDYASLSDNATVDDLIPVSMIVPATTPNVNAVGSELDKELWEEYTYAYTYYDRDSGFESAPVFSATFLKKTNELDITNISYSTETNVDVIRVYRLGGYSSSYRLVIEIDNIATTGTTTYRDTLAEEYNPYILDTQNLKVIEDLKQLVEHKGTMYAYKNNIVYFSRPGKPNMWSEFNSIRVGGQVSGLASTPLGVLIFTTNSQTYLLGGTDKYNFTLSSLTKTSGCISYKSIANLKNTAIWLDYEGLMLSVGSVVSNLSKEKVDLTDIGEIYTSLVYNSVYYLVGENYTMAVDFRYNSPSFCKLTNIDFITVYKGKLYGKFDGSLYEDILDKVGGYLELHYKAPKFIGNSYDILTEFEKINLTYKGDFTFTIYVDEVEVLSDTISSNKIAVEEIKIPTDNNEGLSIELELIGTGEIHSFRYIFSNVNIN